MNTVVWKAVLRVDHLQTVETPEGAELLFVHEQDGNICIWFACNPAHKREFRTIMIVGTGHVMLDEGVYIGSVVIGALVFHVFEVPKEE